MGTEVDVFTPYDYIGYMIASLRDSKANLSRLVERAASGEEILITVRGRPRARLVGAPQSRMDGWAAELQTVQRRHTSKLADGSVILDELREDRW